MGQDFHFFFEGNTSKTEALFKKSLGTKAGSFSACEAGSPLNRFLISVLFPPVPVKWL